MENPGLLIVVHPGSLCGSLDMHLGEAADDVRAAIAKEIDEWGGSTAVVGGDLSDELEDFDYRDLGYSVRSCDYETRGEATALGLKRAARRIAKQFELKPGAAVRVTGAWKDKDGSGCVSAVANALSEIGMVVTISENAPASD